MNHPDVADLNRQIIDKETELATMRSLHASVAATYGSELCAGDMLGQEDRLAAEIESLKATRDGR